MTVGSRRCATRVVSFCCCAIAVSFCERMRSMSPGRNAASLVTSVIRSSDGARFGESAFSSTYERSAPLLVLTSAPSRSSASAICCEDLDARALVEQVHRHRREAARIGAVGGRSSVEHKRDLRDRDRRPLDVFDRDSVRQSDMADLREVERGELADRRELPRSLDRSIGLRFRRLHHRLGLRHRPARSPGERTMLSAGRLSHCCIAERTAAGVIAA